MKTTLDIKDELLLSAKQLADRTGRPLRAVVEEGLRLVLSAQPRSRSFQLEDCSVGDSGQPDPLESRLAKIEAALSDMVNRQDGKASA